MLLHDLVTTSGAVAATRSRKAKVAAIAELLARADVDELEIVTAYLGGTLLQRRTGLGWRGLTSLPPPADSPSLDVREVDAAFAALAGLAGAGSQAARSTAVADLFGRATAEEQAWLRGVVTGEVRQGALDALVQEAVAAATGVHLSAVRRAAMLSGSTVAVARLAFTGGEAALARVGLNVLRPVLPMLASSAPTVAAAMTKAGRGGPVSIDTKLDGIRIQVHRAGDAVRIATRSLEDITARLPEVVEVARSLPAESFVLDGEALALDEEGRPRPFQETASRTAQASGVHVTPYFFDLLHLDGVDLLEAPLTERVIALERLVPPRHLAERIVTADPEEASAFVARVLDAGHEGVVVKDPAAPYDAGRRGASWIKVKPVHTLDLVVLAVEWGSGRRRGWLSNIHLGARDDTAEGGFVMLGKTFKGMTDEVLAWQTERFLALETHREGHVVFVRPEQVVEIALDGVQQSPRYPAGMALRFARVVRYREDKTAGEADTVATVRDLFGR
ncbi:ATP-dependent DNA ligase [Nocardioides sp. cx-169]|uniref:ATP-dependent DNA ligase n=1 Tax=Nocardioides sp. cx-169 TaxID=2899080 RepID=UPI001E3FCB1F|nr:ATP-dependent DNA ligase [Nocardioides sp. cx-169]MCD4534926.1 ATP-dependent DNA ligase [Nocardioides sp. cx-169]